MCCPSRKPFAAFCQSVLCWFSKVKWLGAKSGISKRCRAQAGSRARRSGKSQPTAARLRLLWSSNLGGSAFACAGMTQGVVLAGAQFSLNQLIQIWEEQLASPKLSWGAQCCSGALW